MGLGTLVVSATFRPPRVLAKAVATLDEMAPGRLTLGLGAGWLREEHEAFALPFPPHAERLARLVETIEAVRDLAPGVPVLVGGASSSLMSVAARHADLWNAPADRLDELPAARRGVPRARGGGGADGGPGGARGRAARRRARRGRGPARAAVQSLDPDRPGPAGLRGRSATILARIGEHRRLGVERFVLGFSQRDALGGAMEAFAERVIAPAREGMTDTRQEDP